MLTVTAAILSVAVWASEITVGGKGVVKARPDRVSLTFEVSTLNMKSDVGFAALKAKNETLAAALTEAQVKADEMKISNLRMNPQYEYGSMGRTFKGYRQAVTYVVTIELDMDRVQKIYKTIAETKTGEEISLDFFIGDDRKYRSEAKRLAVKDAKATAELLAEASGVKLGKVEEISYQAGEFSPLRRNAMTAKLAFAPESDGMGLATTAVDDIVISENVIVVWTID